MNCGYGQELILDIHDCDPVTYRQREDLEKYIIRLCKLIGVEKADLHWWDYAGYPADYEAAPDRIKGTSVVQFILTSTIVIHTLDVLRCVYINIFSCDKFDADSVVNLSTEFFKGTVVTNHNIVRK